jgi:hypothetical protein
MENVFEVANEGRPIVMIEPMRRVLSMVAEIEKNQLVTLAQRFPKRHIAVDRQAIAVAQREPRSVRIPVLADADDRAVLHHGIDRFERRWHLDTQSRSFLSVARLAAGCADAIDNLRAAQNFPMPTANLLDHD